MRSLQEASARQSLPGDGDLDVVPDTELAARVASGPGFWTGWLAELDRQGQLEELLAENVIARALREAPTATRPGPAVPPSPPGRSRSARSC
jgi:hypothetical protein